MHSCLVCLWAQGSNLQVVSMADAMPSPSLEGSKERSSALPLTLTTLAGEESHIVIDPHEHDRLHGFENAVLEQLPYLGSNSTFGCELQFVQKNTHKVLADPIRGTLRANQCFYVLARQCFVEAVHKGQLKGEAKAIRVPFGKNDKIPPQAFSFHTEVRHVLVEAGIRIVGEAAWRSCQRLQVVHLPDRHSCQPEARGISQMLCTASGDSPWMQTVRH